MFRFCRRLLCFALAFLLVSALFPADCWGSYAKADSTTYGIVTAEDVNFRIGPSMKERHFFRVAKGTVCPVLGTTKDDEGIVWYQANAVNPETGGEFTGYIRGDCFRMLTDAEETAYRNGTLITTNTTSYTVPVSNNGAASSDILGYVQTIKGSVNIRASIGGTSLTQVGIYVTMPYLVAPIRRGNYTWYFVQVSSGVQGYVRGDCVRTVNPSTSTGTTTTVVINNNTISNNTGTTIDVNNPTGYLKTKIDDVNVRKGIWGDRIAIVKKAGTEFPFYGEPKVSGSTTWYFIKGDFGYAYIHGGFVTVTAQYTPAPTVTNTGSVTPAPTAAPLTPTGYLKTKMDKVNVRDAIWGETIYVVQKAGTEFPYYGEPTISGSTKWYRIKGDFGYAYIHGNFVTVTATYTPTPTPAPTATSTTTGSVTPTPTPTPIQPSGYLKTKMDKVNVRDAIWGETIYVVQKAGTEFPYYGEPTTSGSTKWYRIKGDFGYAYIHGGFVTVTASYTPTPTPAPTATSTGSITPTPTPTPIQPSGYLKTKMDKVNVRDGIWGETIYVVQKAGTEFPYYGEPTVSGSTKWYRIKGEFGYAYIHGNYVTVTATYTPTPTPAPTATTTGSITPTPTPTPIQPSGYVKTKMDKVNVRDAIWGETIYVVQKAGTEFPYYGEPTVSGSTKWYRIKGEFGYAYIHGNYVTVTASYTPTPTPTATSGFTPAPTSYSPSGGKNEASYTTLRFGSKGIAVENLVTELINQGFYSGAVTNNYTSAVEKAVRSFQAANGLAQDGVAGNDTQHALFHTVPIGQGDRSNLTMDIYPAEKINWYTGGIQELWPRGSNFKIYDVETKLVWWAHRWSGGKHVDAEPLTAADTAQLCKIYSLSHYGNTTTITNAQQIADNNLYQRRACLVTIGTRTFACSLYGVPHNYPDGDTIKDNNYNGQLCIHFTGSKTHDSDKVDTLHTQAIEDAWMNAPNGHK